MHLHAYQLIFPTISVHGYHLLLCQGAITKYHLNQAET